MTNRKFRPLGLTRTPIDYDSRRALAWEPKPAKRHRPTGEADYRVGDVVLCKVTGRGLQAGRVYPVEVVLHRRAGRKVETLLTVRAGEQLVEIPSPEPVLARTRLVAEIDCQGRQEHYYFADAAEMQNWCELNRIRRGDVLLVKYIEL